MKYYCDSCGRILDEDEVEFYEELGSTRLICTCGSDEVYEATACLLCGEPLPPEQCYCEECAETMREAWNNAVAYVKESRAKHKPATDVASILWEFLL